MDAERRQIEQILSGDPKAFENFIETYKRLVYHVLFRLVRNDADREDLCQDVFVKAYQNLKGFKNEARISTWLAKIAYHTALNFLNKKRAELLDDYAENEGNLMSHIPSPGETPAQLIENRDRKGILEAAISKLGEQQKTILSLYHWQEMSYDEISDILELPIGTVKNYLFRARKALKKQLERQYEEQEL